LCVDPRFEAEHQSLWEKLELCDSREAVSQKITSWLTHRFAAVVTSGVSHRYCVRIEDLR
jgi:hypothetical protein